MKVREVGQRETDTGGPNNGHALYNLGNTTGVLSLSGIVQIFLPFMILHKHF